MTPEHPEEIVAMPTPSESGRKVIVKRSSDSFFDASKLRLARDLAQLSQTELAARVKAAGYDFGAPAISQWENKRNKPSRASVTALAAVLEVPETFFAVDQTATEYDARPAFFRSLSSTPPKVRRHARARAQVAQLLVRAIETHVDLVDVRIPEHELAESASPDELEAVAIDIRKQLGIKPGPIPDLVRVIEQHGGMVIRLDEFDAKVDAFSVTFTDRPLIVLGNDKRDRARSRFDAAHELAHVVCHRATPADRSHGNKKVERQAHRIGAAILMPADEIGPEFRKIAPRFRFDDLMPLKAKWNVSLAALIHRAHDLGILDDSRNVAMNKTIRMRGWNKPNAEPGPLGAPENPRSLVNALRFVFDAGYTLEALAREANLPLGEVEAVVSSSTDPRPKLVL